jgi:glycosyltransferase involved in cell wall biosynthesis
MKKLDFTVTVSMILFNDEKILDECLNSIRNQDYDQKLIDILVIDGGSIDATLDIGKKYGATVVYRPDLKDKPYLRGGMALTTPRTDLILFFSADNRLQERDTLSKMVEAFLDESIVGCETLRYGYRKTDPAISRYFALIGGADPIAVGLGKADRGPHDAKKWHLSDKAEDCGNYYKVGFSNDIAKIPTLGANGFLFRRKLVEKSSLALNCTHTDLCVDWIRQGYNQFAFVKDRHVIHFINVKFLTFIKRRLHYEQMYSHRKMDRIYSIFQKMDTPRLLYIIVTYLTFLVPTLRALKGFLSVRDPAWFLHPIVCFSFVLSYSFHFIRKGVLSRFPTAKGD